MSGMNTDGDWELWGQTNPYYGVLSDSKFLGDKLTQQNYKEFYESGENDIANLMKLVSVMDGQAPKFGAAVDFGCGLGRLTIPLSKYADKVFGLDVSASMISKASQNISPKNKKVKFLISDDNLGNLPGKYDLVYSNIVLQHIPPKRGMKIVDKLLGNLQADGYAALQFTFRHESPQIKKLVINLRNNIPLVHYTLNVVKNKPLRTPHMRMHLYDPNEVLALFHNHGLNNLSLNITNHGGYIGAMIVGKKDARQET